MADSLALSLRLRRIELKQVPERWREAVAALLTGGGDP